MEHAQSPSRDGGFELVEGVQEIAADGEQLQEDMQDTAQGIASPPRQVSDHSIVTDEGEEDVDTSDWGTDMYEEEMALIDYSGDSDVIFSDEEEDEEDDMMTDESDWEDVDDGNDSVYSIPPTLTNLAAPGDPLLWGMDSSHDPRSTSVCHAGACFFRKGRTAHPALSHTFHKQAGDSMRLFRNAAGTQEFVTVAGSQTQGALGVWPLTTNPPPVSLEQPPSNQHAAGAVAGQPPQLATRVGDRPLTIVTAHGGRVVMTGGEGGLVEIFARYPLPLQPAHTKDHRTCTSRGGHTQAASTAAPLAASEGAAPGTATSAAQAAGGGSGGEQQGEQQREQTVGQGGEMAPERLVPAWIIKMDAMVNYLSIGMVAGHDRLLISAQHTVGRQSLGYVHLLDIPPPGSQQPGSMQCSAQELLRGETGAQRGRNTTTDMPVYERGEFGTFLRKHGMVDPEAGRAATSVRAISLGSWPCAVNCAVASPDGEWIAVVGDDLRVWLLLRKMGYHYSRAVVLTMTNPPNARRHQHGFQYVAWSPDSSRVAATADSSAMCVCVWDVHLRQQTHHLHVDRPLMGVVFAPWDASLLACAARREVVHVLQLLPEGRLHHQALSCGMVRRPTEEMHEHVQCLSRIITGMTIDAETRSLLIAQRFRVLQYHFVRPWALETHGDYPEAFRAAARTMLLAAKRVGDEDAVGLWSLPRDTVLHILKHAAEPLHAWFSEEAAVNAPA